MDPSLLSTLDVFRRDGTIVGKAVDGGTEWKTYKDIPFSERHLEDHFNGKGTYGFFSRRIKHSFVIDIDVHSIKHPALKKSAITEAYNHIINRFYFPSFLVTTWENGGLHLWYKLDSWLPGNMIDDLVTRDLKIPRKALWTIDVSPYKLRAPFNAQMGGSLLNPKTLEFINVPREGRIDFLSNYIQKAISYHPTDLFSISQFIRPKNKKLSRGQLRQRIGIELAFGGHFERHLNELSIGETNKPLLGLIFTAYCQRLNEDEATDVICSNLERLEHLGRNKDLTPERIKQRIKSEYGRFIQKGYKRNISTSYEEWKRKRQLDLMELPWVNGMMDKYFPDITHKPRVKSIMRFLYCLYEWTIYIRDLDPLQRDMLNASYQYFTHRTKKLGLTPLPWTLLKGWCFRHDEIFKRLTKGNVIKLEKRHYSAWKEREKANLDIMGTCRYYRVNISLFNALEGKDTHDNGILFGSRTPSNNPPNSPLNEDIQPSKREVQGI